jgi:diguanylate cyclase (GGDEF)-like protein
VSGEAKDLSAAIRSLAPFIVATCLAWTVVLVGSRIAWGQYLVSTALALVAGGLGVLGMKGQPDRHLGVVPGAVDHGLGVVRAARDRGLGVVPGALLSLVAVGLLRDAAGGISSGTSALAMIPVFYTALYSRSRRDLALVVGGVGLFYLAPILIVGPPAYPPTQYRMALLSVTVSTIIGFATQRLVASVRCQASEARRRERMLEQLGDVVRGLFDSPHARVDVCQAAKSISDADVALLYEPSVDGGGELHCTAMTAVASHAAGLPAGRRSAVHEAFRSGSPTLVTADIEARVGNIELWIASGRPRSVLYQPLMRHGVALGVLVVGWSHDIRAGDTHTTIAALLAHEAAAVIARADVLHHLTGEAQTDPLTGLPNRRAWDVQVKRALGEPGELAIAMLDLDHFKRFNDTYGHPAGDRLLKSTAAAWRDQLRTGDLLARLGGEEFGLLLRDCDIETATEVADRLRSHVSDGWTCSAGIAMARTGESADVVIARADEALYEAKSRGRDRTHLTV